MKRNPNLFFRFVILVALTGIMSVATAQFGQRGVVSPVVHDDGSVTFKLLARQADKVSLSGSWMQGWGASLEMSRNDTGLWSLTIDPIPSEMYTYTYQVDGVRTLDPANGLTVRDGVRNESMFIVKGQRGELYSSNDVPHGTLSKVWYSSPVLKMNRRMYVYTPPGYADGNQKYPVLYLLHGAGGDEDAWTTLGRTPYILDNLIAAGKALPMIVVMTNGNAWAAAAPGEAPAMAAPADRMSLAGKFEESLVKDVIPFIEKNYRVLTDPGHRAIAGLSMGGGHTMTITNNNPGLFSYVGVMSMGLMTGNRMGNYDADKHKGQIAALKDSGLKLYWIGCGKQDFLYEGVVNLRKLYDEQQFKYEYFESEGGHTWPEWRIYLSELAPKLFK